MNAMTVDLFTNPLIKSGACSLVICLGLGQSLLHGAQDDEVDVAYTEAQATQGKLGYEEHCATCHGFNLEGFDLVPGLSGSYFAERWGDTTADQLASDVMRMPPSAEDLLD